MLDWQNERLFSLPEMAIELSRVRQRPMSKERLKSWIERGFDGEKLESVRWGKTLCTSLEAIDRFVTRLSHDEYGNRKKRSERANRELDRIGVGP